MTKVTSTPDEKALAQQLRRLRRDGNKIATAQLLSVPSTLRDAMKIQSLLSQLEGGEASAWKVAKSPDGDPVVARLHPYIDNPAGSMIAWRKGMKIEVEIAVKLGRDLPVRADIPYVRNEIEGAIADVYLGAELVWSSLEEGGSISFLAFLADRLGNMGYVQGPRLPAGCLQPGSDIPLALWLNKQMAYNDVAKHPTGDVLTWLCDYANDKVRTPALLKAGTIITTGSLCGALSVSEPGDVSVKLGENSVMNFALKQEP